MSGKFKAWWATELDGKANVELVEVPDSDLEAGEVTVGVHYSTINYKDGMAIQGNISKIMRAMPMAPGIDYSGVVEASDNDKFTVGDEVVLTGWGVGENVSGGLSQRARAKAEWLVRKPEGLSLQQTMAIGTAGFTAMMSILALEDAGVKPESGDVIVTGAAGGVGSIAVAVLSNLGYNVVASTGREGEHEYLKNLGANKIVPRDDLNKEGRPLGRETWAGGSDTVGSHFLVNVLAQTKPLGTVAVCGLAAGPDLPGTVLPFILRGVRIWGIDSAYCPVERRVQAWTRLAEDLPLKKLNAMTQVRPMADVPSIASDILKGQVRDRTVIDVNG